MKEMLMQEIILLIFCFIILGISGFITLKYPEAVQKFLLVGDKNKDSFMNRYVGSKHYLRDLKCIGRGHLAGAIICLLIILRLIIKKI
jgi:hypothetical protein